MHAVADAEWIGRKVRIRAVRNVGSAYRLNGLTAVVTGMHPITPDWYLIHLDENEITTELDWSIPADRVVIAEQPAPNVESESR